jgi:hypothetical protein
MDTTQQTGPVELFERGGGWVAAGNADQWLATYKALVAYGLTLDGRIVNLAPWDQSPTLKADAWRAGRLEVEAYRAVGNADQYGRVSMELFASEAEIIRQALA